LQFLVTGMFDYAARKIINAFEGRARELYRPVGDRL
jgi:ribosome-associated toxin RatA of RatAB toxin-antitoxin module